MVHATLRESGDTLHHIEGADTSEILATAGLLAEAINYRNGGTDHALALSVVSEGFEGCFSVDEYTIREKGVFWLLS